MSQATLIPAYLVILGIGVAASVTDVRTHRIPNKLTGLAMLGAMAFWLVAGIIEGRGVLGTEQSIDGTLMASFLGLLCGLVPFGILATLGGLGGGDMKLMGAIGAWSAKWQVVLGTAIYAMLAGALMAIALMIWHKRIALTLTRLLGIAVSRGKAIQADDDPSSPKVPFAIALAVGAAIAGAEHMLRLWPTLLW